MYGILFTSDATQVNKLLHKDWKSQQIKSERNRHNIATKSQQNRSRSSLCVEHAWHSKCYRFAVQRAQPYQPNITKN